MARHREEYENDTTPSGEVVKRYRAAILDVDSEESLALAQYRGGEEEFRLGRDYCASDDPYDRATGAHLLGQLGWSDQTFLEESVALLIPLLEDPDPYVVYSAGIALGHRESATAIPFLLRQISHPDANARYGIAHGLSGHEDERAVAALIRLAGDEDSLVRDWTTFGLGSQIEMDTPEIRDALKKALKDEDEIIRGEALAGLANRKDPEIVSLLLEEWRSGEIVYQSLEAAEIAADPRLHESLCGFRAKVTPESSSMMVRQLENAISACAPGGDSQAPKPA